MYKALSLSFIALLFVISGVMHFTHTDDLAAITPLPLAREIVWITGIMEFLFAVFLLMPKYRQATALWLSLFCLLVLPANINMAINDLPMFGEQVDPTILWLRIPMQFVLIAWILTASDAFSALRQRGLRAWVTCARQS